jgi:hypothetical protein
MGVLARLSSGSAFLFILCSLAWPCARADDIETRVARPAVVFQFSRDTSPLEHFEHWKVRFISPVFCPIMLCHGSCADSDQACVLNSTAVIVNAGGCGGGCTSAAPVQSGNACH